MMRPFLMLLALLALHGCAARAPVLPEDPCAVQTIEDEPVDGGVGGTGHSDDGCVEVLP